MGLITQLTDNSQSNAVLVKVQLMNGMAEVGKQKINVNFPTIFFAPNIAILLTTSRLIWILLGSTN